MRQYIPNVTAAVLTFTLTVGSPLQVATGQEICVPQKRHGTADSRPTPSNQAAPQTAQPRVLDLPNVPPARRAELIAKMDSTTIPIVDAALLSDPQLVRQLRESSAFVAMLQAPQVLNARARLAQQIDGIVVVSGIPRTREEIRAIYGDSIAAASQVERQMRDASAEAATLTHAPLHGTVANTIARESSRTDVQSALVVFAHNENGHLKLPDGSSLHLATIQRHSDASRRPVVVFTCDDADLFQQTPSLVATLKRLDLGSTARALAESHDPRTVGMLLTEFAHHYESPENQLRNRILFALLNGVVLVVVAMALDDDE